LGEEFEPAPFPVFEMGQVFEPPPFPVLKWGRRGLLALDFYLSILYTMDEANSR
jgi:hypothetical protein